MSAEPSADDPRVRDLLGILEITRRLAATPELDTLLAAVEESTRRVIGCERASVFLHDVHTDELYSRLATGASGIRFPADRGVAGAALRGGELIHVPDAYADPRFNPDVDRATGFHTTNVLACPLVGWDGVPVGVMQAINKADGGFTPWDETVLRTLAAQVGVAIQRQVLLEALAAKQAIDRELAIAHMIQQRLLPAAAPPVPGYDLAGWNQPAAETGGDFFDFLPLPEGRLALAVGDATGHGVGPALMTTGCRAFARAVLSETWDLAAAIPRVNHLLCADMSPGHFVTAFFGVLDPHSHRLTYLSAGQGPVVLFRGAGGMAVELDVHGPPLGLFPELPFDPVGTVEFEPGDVLVLLTDGFYEWANPNRERFGSERMGVAIRAVSGLASGEVIREAYKAVTAFAAGTPQHDDLTAVVVKRR
jgi:phosphoserine phosphatase